MITSEPFEFALIVVVLTHAAEQFGYYRGWDGVSLKAPVTTLISLVPLHSGFDSLSVT